MIDSLAGLLGIRLELGGLIFLACVALGGIGLLVTVVFDGVLDALDIQVGGESLAPFATAFVSLFGLGGLFAQQLAGMSAGPAAVVGIVTGGIGGFAMTSALRLLRRAEDPGAPTRGDLVGRSASAEDDLGPGRTGEIVLTVDGMSTRFRATAAVEIARGSAVTVLEDLGGRLVVGPRA